MIDQSNDGSPRGLKETERELLQSMVIKLSAAAVGGQLAPWFAIWRDRAAKLLENKKKSSTKKEKS